MTAAFCSDHTRDLAEPMVGTVGVRRAWILVQNHEAWGAKAFHDSGVPEAVKAHLLDAAAGAAESDEKPENAVLLIRSDQPREPEVKRLFVVRSNGVRPFVRGFEFRQPEQIVDLPIAAALAGEEVGEACGDLFLVCTNGSRDRCCAKYGLPLFRHLKGAFPGAVWRSSHLGGHRFAPTMAWLPYGVYFGRVAPDEAVKLVEDARAGHISLAHYRGRSVMPKSAQVAEYLLRREQDMTEVGRLDFVAEHQPAEDRTEVRFHDRDAGAEHAVVYTTTWSDEAQEVMPSCGKTEYQRLPRYHCVDVREL